MLPLNVMDAAMKELLERVIRDRPNDEFYQTAHRVVKAMSRWDDLTEEQREAVEKDVQMMERHNSGA